MLNDFRIKPPPKEVNALFTALSYMLWDSPKRLTIQETIDCTIFVLDFLEERGLTIGPKINEWEDE